MLPATAKYNLDRGITRVIENFKQLTATTPKWMTGNEDAQFAPSAQRLAKLESSFSPISFPKSSFPLTSGRKTRALGTTIFK